MLVLEAVVVVEVEFGDAGAEKFEGVVKAGVAEMGVAYVEGNAYVAEVTDAKNLEEVLGGGDFVLEVFEEDFDAEGMGEGLDVLDGGEGVLKGAGVPGVVLEAEMEGDGGDGNLLGGLEGALDLVHGVDAVGLLGRDEGEGGGDVARPVFGLLAGEDGLVKGGRGAGVAEPGGDLAELGAVGVVEVMAGGEEFDGSGAAVAKGVKQAGVQALLKEDVGREAGLHRF